MKKKYLFAGLVAVAAAIPLATFAADHLDPPSRTNPDSGGADRSSDIGDLYAWHTSDSVVMALTYDGPNPIAANQELSCDNNVLYTIHIDNDGDASTSEFEIYTRFGKDSDGRCFMRVENAPGAGAEPIVGRVETINTRDDVRVFAGLRDDPFFFDLQGFQDTLNSGDLSFVNDRDFFAMQNISAIVIEVPLTAISPNGNTLNIWAATAKK